MPSDILKELRSVVSLLSTEATTNKLERCPKITEYFKDKNKVTFEIPSMSICCGSISSINPVPASAKSSVSKAILQELIRNGGLFSTKTAKHQLSKQSNSESSSASSSSSPADAAATACSAAKGGGIDHTSAVKNMSNLLIFQRVQQEEKQDNGSTDCNRVDDNNKETESKAATEDVSFIASTFAQNLKTSICKVTDDNVIYFLSNLLEKTVKGNKGILPYEAAKILAHYSTIDNLNTEEADNELAMKSFQENEGKEALEKTGDNEYDGKELKGEVGDRLSKSTQNDNHVKTTSQPNSSVNEDSHNSINTDKTKDDNEEARKDIDKDEMKEENIIPSKGDIVDHVAKIKSIHDNSPSLREMLGLNDEHHLQELPSLETRVKKFSTSFTITEDAEKKFTEGKFSCAIKFNAILTLVILKHETTLQISEIGKISGLVNKDDSFKDLSLTLQMDSFFESLHGIIKSSVESAIKSNITTRDIPNQRFKVKIAPVSKIIAEPKLVDDSSQDAQASRKRRRSELNVNDIGDSASNKRNSMASSLLSMASMGNYAQDGANRTLTGHNDKTMGNSMTNMNSNRLTPGIFGQNHIDKGGSMSMAAMFGQNAMQPNNIQGLNHLMNINHCSQQNITPKLNTNQLSMNMNVNGIDVMNNMSTMSARSNTNSVGAMNSMNSMSASSDKHSTTTDRYHQMPNVVNDAVEAVRMAERRQSLNRQNRALAVAAAERATMRDLKSAMLKRRHSGQANGMNSMAAAAEAVRLAEMENKLDSLGSKIGDGPKDSNGNNLFNNGLNKGESQSNSTAELLRLLESRSSMVAPNTSQINTDQSQIMDIEAAVNTLRRHSNIGTSPVAPELSGILETLGRDEGVARRRSSSFGGNMLMENVLKALRRQSASVHSRTSEAGSMAAAAEAVRLAEMDVMNSIRRRSSAGNSMAAAAEIVRQADLDAAINTLRRRSSSAGKSSIATAAEAVRLAEMENNNRRRSFTRRHSSYGATSAMAAAAEIVRLSEESNAQSNPSRNFNTRRSFVMSDEMMRDSDELSNAIRAVGGAGNSSTVADATRLVKTDGNYSSLLNQNNNYLMNQNNLETHQRARRSVSFRLNNTSRDYNPINHAGGGNQG